MINKIIIIFFCCLTLILTINSYYFQTFSNHIMKKNDEMYDRIYFLSKLHKAFDDTLKDNSIIRFVYPMNYIKRKSSYFNNYHSHSRNYDNYYWVYEKGNELYGLDNSNIFKVNEFTSIFLKSEGIDLNDICKKINNTGGKLNFSKNIVFYNEDSIEVGNHIVKLNYKFKTKNRFSSLTINDSDGQIIARAEINLQNSVNLNLLSHFNKIINSDNSIILLDVISKSPSNQLMEISEIEFILFKTNKNDYKIIFEFYNDKYEFDKYSDEKNNDIYYKINSIEQNIFPIKKNVKIINCK